MHGSRSGYAGVAYLDARDPTEEMRVDAVNTMLRLLGFYEELSSGVSPTTGLLREAVRAEPLSDEAEIIRYLENGHVLVDVMEWERDALTGESHRRSAGASTLMTDGEWLWRHDLSHYAAAHHVELPEEFLTRVRGFSYEMPELVMREFGPRFDATMPMIGWKGLPPWPSDQA
jgi:hypothetical protein